MEKNNASNFGLVKSRKETAERGERQGRQYKKAISHIGLLCRPIATAASAPHNLSRALSTSVGQAIGMPADTILESTTHKIEFNMLKSNDVPCAEQYGRLRLGSTARCSAFSWTAAHMADHRTRNLCETCLLV